MVSHDAFALQMSTCLRHFDFSSLSLSLSTISSLWINQNSIKSPHYFPLWSAMAAFNYYPRQGGDIRRNRMIIIRTNLNESLGWQTDISYNYVFFICCPCHIFWLLRRSMQWKWICSHWSWEPLCASSEEWECY